MTEIVDPAEKRFEPFARRFLVEDVSPRLRSLPGKIIVFGRLPWEIGQRERASLAQQLADEIESRLPELELGRPSAILVSDRLELDIVRVEGPGVLTWGGQILRVPPIEAVIEAETEALVFAIVRKINRGQLILFDVDRRILLLQSLLIGLEGTRLNEAILRIDPRLLGCIDEVVLVTRDGCHWGHGEPT
jgi:hypothetical protein